MLSHSHVWIWGNQGHECIDWLDDGREKLMGKAMEVTSLVSGTGARFVLSRNLSPGDDTNKIAQPLSAPLARRWRCVGPFCCQLLMLGVRHLRRNPVIHFACLLPLCSICSLSQSHCQNDPPVSAHVGAYRSIRFLDRSIRPRAAPTGSREHARSDSTTIFRKPLATVMRRAACC